MAKPEVIVELTWMGDLAFRSETRDGRHATTDGNSRAGLSPVEMLATSIAGCMAVDVVHILTRSRLTVHAVRASFRGERAESDPHRLVRASLVFDIEGPVPQTHADRALQLSRDKYCSVWNSLRQDIPLEVSARITTPAASG